MTAVREEQFSKVFTLGYQIFILEAQEALKPPIMVREPYKHSPADLDFSPSSFPESGNSLSIFRLTSMSFERRLAPFIHT